MGIPLKVHNIPDSIQMLHNEVPRSIPSKHGNTLQCIRLGGNWSANELRKQRETDLVVDRVRNDMGQFRITVTSRTGAVESDSSHYT